MESTFTEEGRAALELVRCTNGITVLICMSKAKIGSRKIFNHTCPNWTAVKSPSTALNSMSDMKQMLRAEAYP